MFATLHYGPNNKEPVYVERTNHPPVQGQGHQHSACDNCRAKKLKCTGQKNRCERCQSKGIACTFTSAGSKGGAKRRRVSRPPPPGDDSTSNGNGSTSAENSSAGSTPHRTKMSSTTTTTAASNTDFFDPSPDSATFEELLHTPPMDGGNGPLGDDYFTELPLFSDTDEFLARFLNDLDQEPMNEQFCPRPRSDTSTSTTSSSTSHFPLPSPPATVSPPAGLVGSHPDNQLSPADSMMHKSESLCFQMLPSPTPSGCVCLQKAVDILEELETAASECGNNQMDNSCVDQVLSTHKRALVQCSSMLCCESCSLRSAVVMTLIAVCEKMLNAFERVSRNYQLQNDNSQNTPPSISEDAVSLAMLSARQGMEFAGYLGKYKVDTDKEWRSLISVLVLLQLKELGTLLGKLKTVATQLNWETHLTMVVSFDRRLREAISSLHCLGLSGSS
ncbi:hypothetical protein FN846DRAFT_587829 [Sphaerosporella brunnea]|uniref:Zn(2)-C6 fungal-type domain-containing protein n=1 Tax=Sphaerosporella brunnea TaxID=1250544 RepID=A0A5J5F1Y4_9PEZI|nr:hypothetical protein FN846DRAFT_587829 [Sphaerosporella brunnea]